MKELKQRLDKVTIKGSAFAQRPDKVTIRCKEISYTKTNSVGLRSEIDTGNSFSFKLNNNDEVHELVFRFLDEGQYKFFMLRLCGGLIGNSSNKAADNSTGFDNDNFEPDTFYDEPNNNDDSFVFDTDDDF